MHKVDDMLVEGMNELIYIRAYLGEKKIKIACQH